MRVSVPCVGDSDDVWIQWLEKDGSSVSVHGERNELFSLWLQQLTRVMSTWQSAHRIKNAYVFVRSDEADGETVANFLELLRDHLTELLLGVNFGVLKAVAEKSSPRPNLRVLSLHEVDVSGDDGVALARMLSLCSSLESLSLWNCGFCVTETVMKHFPFATLKMFTVRDPKLNDLAGVARILRGCHRIRSVSVAEGQEEASCVGLTDVLLSLSDKPAFEELRLHVLLSEENFQADTLERLSSLKSLNLSFHNSDEFFEQMCQSVRHLSRLKELCLHFDSLTVGGDRVLSELLMSSSNISRLDLFSVEIISLQNLAGYLSSASCRLCVLNIRCDGEMDVTAVARSLKWNRSLMHLEIWLAEADNMKAAALAFRDSFRHNRTLRKLRYAGKICDDDLKQIVAGMRYSTVEEFFVMLRSSVVVEEIDEVAKMGYLVHVVDIVCSAACEQRMKFNKLLHRAARRTIVALLWARRFRKTVLNALFYEIVKLISKELFATRCCDEWENAFDDDQEVGRKRRLN